MVLFWQVPFQKDSLTPMELEEGGGQFADPNTGVQDILATRQGLFKCLTNFSLTELVQLVVSTIIGHVRSTWEPHHISRRPSKLTPEQCFLNFILYIKHNNVTKYDAFLWNWRKIVINDDGILISSCINSTIVNEIHHCQWNLMAHYWGVSGLGYTLPQFQGCIRFTDGTLIKIHKPCNNPTHWNLFHGQKQMYYMNNTIVVDQSTTMGCSYIWSSSIPNHSMTSISCGNQTSTWTGVNTLFT